MNNIIFLDEIDPIIISRNDSQDEHEGRSKQMETEWLIQLDRITKNEDVFLLSENNIIWDLDLLC